MLNSYNIYKIKSERLGHFPSVDSVLKISLGLMLLTVISLALIYAETMPVIVDGNSFDVQYSVTGMTVSGIVSDTNFASLIIAVDVTDSIGVLDITFDRTFFDSIFEGADTAFIILANGGSEPNFTETQTTPQNRTLSIELPAGTEEVEIIGTIFGAQAQIEEPPPAETPPAETPPAETPPTETPPTETPPTETPPTETPKTQCGTGTVLKDGVCVLDKTCGTGTVLKDGVCVVESVPSSDTSVKGMGKEMIMGVVVAFVIAGVVGLVLGIASKASKSSN